MIPDPLVILRGDDVPEDARIPGASEETLEVSALVHAVEEFLDVEGTSEALHDVADRARSPAIFDYLPFLRKTADSEGMLDSGHENHLQGKDLGRQRTLTHGMWRARAGLWSRPTRRDGISRRPTRRSRWCRLPGGSSSRNRGCRFPRPSCRLCNAARSP